MLFYVYENLAEGSSFASAMESRALARNRNRNISLTKGCDKDIISPLGCNSHARGGVMHVGPSSGASLYYDISQMIVVRGGLGVRVGRSLGAVCLANGIFCAGGLVL